MAAVATTPTALRILYPLVPLLTTIWVPRSLAHETSLSSFPQAQHYEGSLADHIAALWPSHRAFVFALAAGATTRLIAPLLRDKATDPAVVVIDGAGEYVISLCGGHQGGADLLARAIATQISATPIITGAAAAQDLAGIDLLGEPFGWNPGSGDWTGVSAAIATAAAVMTQPDDQTPGSVQAGSVQVIQETGSTLWQAHLPHPHPFQFGVPEVSEAPGILEAPEISAHAPTARIWISATQRELSEAPVPAVQVPEIQWHPRMLWVGIGCERGSSRQLIESAITQACQAQHLAEGAIAGIATLDLKADEPGLLELCAARHWPLCCFSAEQLREIPVPTPSPVVQAEVGTPSVAEAAAIVASQGTLRVQKQIHRLEGEPGAVTVAIAQSPSEEYREYTGRIGQLALVGIGPGALDQMTPAAKTAIVMADVIIGYSLYVDLIRPLLRPGQIVEALAITQERARAERAIALAQWGLSVAVISSGDSGIYGMAGLVMESLSQDGWDGKSPTVQVFPGITALQAAAARVGTPLMHDFCAISLSDLLTPWERIEKRLQAAAEADFVVALYNPKSKTRVTQIATAQAIFLRHRSPETPVALVRSAYRDTEQITITTLGRLLDADIDMLTTVLIGNASTINHHDWLITPRGYLGFGEKSLH